MEILEKHYRTFISSVLEPEKPTPHYQLQEILYKLIKMLELRFKVDPRETFDELRNIEKRIETDLSHRFYRIFVTTLEKTEVWSEFRDAIESESAFCSAVLKKDNQWLLPRVKERELLLRPRHLLFLLWHSKEVKPAMECITYTMENAPTAIRSLVPTHALERSCFYVKHNKIMIPNPTSLHEGLPLREELIDRRFVEAAHFREHIEESSNMIFALLSKHFDLLCLQQRKLTEEIEYFERDLRDLAEWANKFVPNKNMLEVGGIQ